MIASDAPSLWFVIGMPVTLLIAMMLIAVAIFTVWSKGQKKP